VPAAKLPTPSVIDDALSDSHQTGIVTARDGWVPPGNYDSCTQWALDNRDALEEYASQNEEEGTAAEQLERFLAEHPERLADANGKI
jgi:hypothetical protein